MPVFHGYLGSVWKCSEPFPGCNPILFRRFCKTQFVCSPFGIVATANSVGFVAMTKETVDEVVNPAFILGSNMQMGLLLSMSSCHPTGARKVLPVLQVLLLLMSLLQQLHL